MKLVFLDTETTSLKDGRLVQLAYLPFDSNEKLPAIPYEKKFKPPFDIGILENEGIPRPKVWIDGNRKEGAGRRPFHTLSLYV